MSSFGGSGHVLMPSTDIERMFSEEDAWGELPSVWEDLQEESLSRLDSVKHLLDKLPPREADFIELYFFRHLRQTAIAELYNVSQPTVCYRLQRGASRLRYLLEMPNHSISDMEKDLRSIISDETDVQIMVRMVDTTCQSDVARDLGVSQGFVRHRFLRTVDRMERMVKDGHPTSETLETYVKVFRLVSKNLNILKNTCRSSWSEEVIHSVY